MQSYFNASNFGNRLYYILNSIVQCSPRNHKILVSLKINFLFTEVYLPTAVFLLALVRSIN